MIEVVRKGGVSTGLYSCGVMVRTGVFVTRHSLSSLDFFFFFFGVWGRIAVSTQKQCEVRANF